MIIQDVVFVCFIIMMVYLPSPVSVAIQGWQQLFWSDSHNNTRGSQYYPKGAPIRHRPLTDDPPQRHNRTSLHMPHNCTADGARAGNDEELGKVDECRQSAAEENHHPFVYRRCLNGGEFVGPGDEDHEHDTANRGLVEEELEAVHLVFTLVGRDPDGVDGADEDAR